MNLNINQKIQLLLLIWEQALSMLIYIKMEHLDFTRIIKDCGNDIDEMLIERNGLKD